MKKSESKFITKLREAGLPQEAIDKFLDMYAPEPAKTILSLEIMRDPYVDGTFAMRVRKIGYHTYSYRRVLKQKKYFHTIDLLWNHGDFDDVEFYTWPPNARRNNLQFFI